MRAATATPAIRHALLLALLAPSHTLVRNSEGFRSQNGTAVSRRTANVLHNALLIEFDNPYVPRAITLTDRGIALAREIHTAAEHVRTSPTGRTRAHALTP